MNTPILMMEEYWASSQLSIVRYYGHIQFKGHDYIIVNKDGKDIFQCSIEAEKEGREKAIEPGEPADLVRKDFVSYYKKIGRDKFLDVLKNNRTTDDKELKKIFKSMKGGK